MKIKMEKYDKENRKKIIEIIKYLKQELKDYEKIIDNISFYSISDLTNIAVDINIEFKTHNYNLKNLYIEYILKPKLKSYKENDIVLRKPYNKKVQFKGKGIKLIKEHCENVKHLIEEQEAMKNKFKSLENQITEIFKNKVVVSFSNYKYNKEIYFRLEEFLKSKNIKTHLEILIGINPKRIIKNGVEINNYEDLSNSFLDKLIVDKKTFDILLPYLEKLSNLFKGEPTTSSLGTFIGPYTKKSKYLSNEKYITKKETLVEIKDINFNFLKEELLEYKQKFLLKEGISLSNK